MKHIETTITVYAHAFVDQDNCLAAAAQAIARQRGLDARDLNPRWVDNDRDAIAMDVPLDDALIRELRTESSLHDPAQVEICNRALAGDEDARAECARAITAASAMGS